MVLNLSCEKCGNRISPSTPVSNLNGLAVGDCCAEAKKLIISKGNYEYQPTDRLLHVYYVTDFSSTSPWVGNGEDVLRAAGFNPYKDEGLKEAIASLGIDCNTGSVGYPDTYELSNRTFEDFQKFNSKWHIRKDVWLLMHDVKKRYSKSHTLGIYPIKLPVLEANPLFLSGKLSLRIYNQIMDQHGWRQIQ